MNSEEYDRMYRLEERYWWYVGRRRLALRLLRRFGGQNPTVLDLGCGTGVVTLELGQVARPIGADFSPRALEYCQMRGLSPLVRLRGEALPMASDSVEAVISLDVFEHIQDHRAAFQESFRVLQPGGILVLSVPAFRSLWGPHDVALHHFRRYRRAEIVGELCASGFEIERASYSVFFLFPLVWLIRQIEKSKRGPAEASLPGVPDWLNQGLVGLQSLEASLIERIALPWGSSVVVVARKPKRSRG